MSALLVLPHWWTVAGVRPGPWEAIVHGITHDAHGDLPGWDYQTPLDLVCSVEVDLGAVRADADLPPDAEVQLVASWTASSTGRRQVGAVVPVDTSGDHHLAVRIDPTEVGGQLRTNRLLVLRDAGRAGSPGTVARRRGAILWYEPPELATVTVLEGDAARFPTEAVDFSRLPIGEPDAAWWLDVHLDDLDAAPLHALRLYVNAEHALVERILGGEESEVAEATRSVLLWDVARTLIDRALDDDRFVADPAALAPDSVGGVVAGLLERTFPDHTAASLRRLRRADPGRYRYTVQARLGLLEGPVTRYLWPRLAPARALAARAALDGTDPVARRDRARSDDPAAATVASGGPVVPADRVADVARRLRGVADAHGWPVPPTADGAEAFDREAAVALHDHMAIIPADAAHLGVWDFLGLVVVPDVVGWRVGEGQDRAAAARLHPLGRLWWRCHVLGRDLVVPPDAAPLTGTELGGLDEHPVLTANPDVARVLVRSVLTLPADERGVALAQRGRRLLRAMPSVCIDLLAPEELLAVATDPS